MVKNSNACALIAHYDALASLSHQMRQAAEQAQWEQLIKLEQQYRHHINLIKAAFENTTPDDATRLKLMQIIQSLLADDAQIRSRTENWMEELKHIIHNNKQEQRLNQSYGSNL